MTIKEMLKSVSKANMTDQSGYVEYGYGQVEPNHLSAQRTGQIYAQLPTKSNITQLENGQFVKYDYATGEVNFTGKGEWMLVFNEIKLYREGQMDCEFAMKQGDYFARVYSPVDKDVDFTAQSRFYGTAEGQPAWKNMVQTAASAAHVDSSVVNTTKETVVAPDDMYELHATQEPFHIASQTSPAMMKAKNAMVPRVFKTNVGDIMTTNMIKEASLELADVLTPGSDGILAKASASTGDSKTPAPNKMVWQVVKLYTLPDHQKAAKIMRIQ